MTTSKSLLAILLPLLLWSLLPSAHAKVTQLSIYLFQSKAIVDVYYEANTTRINLSALLPSPECHLRKIISQVPYSSGNGTLILLTNVSPSFLLLEYSCSYVSVNSNLLGLIIAPRNSSEYNSSIQLFIYNYTPFDAKNLLYDSNFHVYVGQITSQQLPYSILIYAQTRSISYAFIAFALFFASIIAWKLSSFLLKKRKLEKKLLEFYEKVNSETEKKIIKLLVENKGKMFQYEIVKKLKMDKSTVSKALKRMEAKGIVKRKHGPDGTLVWLNLET